MMGRLVRPTREGGMSYFILVRGPLGVGKTTVSERLAKELGAVHISIDRLLDDHGLWSEGRLSEFLGANDPAVRQAQGYLDSGTRVIFDGNFYWKGQIDDLIGRLRGPHFAFTLEAPLEVCIARDRRRDHPHGPQAARDVYRKSTRFTYGTLIDATGSLDTTVIAILNHLSRHRDVE